MTKRSRNFLKSIFSNSVTQHTLHNSFHKPLKTKQREECLRKSTIFLGNNGLYRDCKTREPTHRSRNLHTYGCGINYFTKVLRREKKKRPTRWLFTFKENHTVPTSSEAQKMLNQSHYHVYQRSRVESWFKFVPNTTNGCVYGEIPICENITSDFQYYSY